MAAKKRTAKLPTTGAAKQFVFAPGQWLAALAAGGLLGLASPGFNQWYLAWFALAPLFLFIYSNNRYIKQILLAFCFGLAYNLTYLHWYLNLAPLDWLGFTGIYGYLLAMLAWLITATHQALAFLLFAAIVARLPLKSSFKLTKKGRGFINWPILLLPLLWVLIVNKLGNMPDLMGVPWSMLEYTQYQQPQLLQCASIIGGVGICALIVAVNVTIASLVATTVGKNKFRTIAAENKVTSAFHCLFTAVAAALIFTAGYFEEKALPTNDDIVSTALVQGGINIDMQKTVHRFTIEDLLENYNKLLTEYDCHDQLVVLAEGALPTYLRDQPGVLNWLKNKAYTKRLDLVLGSMDLSAAKRPFNAAYGITSGGIVLSEVYHKRFLVPIGEYTPLMVHYLPEWVKRWTNTPAGGGFAAGKEPVVLALSSGKVAPLICFESISPEVTAASCRAGGQVLANISDLAWFHKSDCGDQMVAFSVLRSIENRRYCLFAANTGPCAIINKSGRIVQYAGQGDKPVLLGKIGLNSKITTFAQWFR